MKWFIKCFKQYVDFKGRARRREFWFFALFCSIISLILMIGIAVPIVKQVSDNTSFCCIDADDDNGKAAIHTENINEANAEEILNMLTEKGIVSPQSGMGPRQIIMDQDQLVAILNGEEADASEPEAEDQDIQDDSTTPQETET